MNNMSDFRRFFLLGMKRDIGELPNLMSGITLELGPGRTPVGDYLLDFPKWNGETDPIPYPDGTFAAVYAFHFLEHLPGAAVLRVLREVERVLRPGGLFYVVVPHRLGAMAFQDIDHKCFWTEESWKTIFSNQYYDKIGGDRPWKLDTEFNLIAGVVERNLALFTVLRRME